MSDNQSTTTAQQSAAPAAGGGDPHINIKVKSQDGTEIYFKIKRTTQLKKLMDAYCTRQGLSINQCRFIFDGERLKDDDTPDKLEMENGDEIDVMVEQTGGYFFTAFGVSSSYFSNSK
ncbi:ubiquitin-like protein smt3 [Stylonychia lemnae]|uniref:Ubiquitin-like protein smt3 n=1 Tax=Stylonychia lemnae TaxID=5949 RepID=A0A077ZV60_STYLE|nr:ubiquitin-like protein smt3 [Stylonychia lemnae]|eukprot:CDW73774.1 ubiquitin-like protein smt3 [Stylonychia lemnae]